MLNFHLTATDPTNDMMMSIARDLIGQVAVAGMGRGLG